MRRYRITTFYLFLRTTPEKRQDYEKDGRGGFLLQLTIDPRGDRRHFLDMDKQKLNSYLFRYCENFKGHLRPKTNSCFYSIILMTLRKKSLIQILWCFDNFKRSYEVTKFWIRREWRHIRECIEHFICFSLHIFLILWKKNLLASFMVVLTISCELMKLQNSE